MLDDLKQVIEKESYSSIRESLSAYLRSSFITAFALFALSIYSLYGTVIRDGDAGIHIAGCRRHAARLALLPSRRHQIAGKSSHAPRTDVHDLRDHRRLDRADLGHAADRAYAESSFRRQAARSALSSSGVLPRGREPATETAVIRRTSVSGEEHSSPSMERRVRVRSTRYSPTRTA